MTGSAPRFSVLGIGLAAYAAATLGFAPVAKAQFFWSPWFQEQPKAKAKPRPAKPRAPVDDLPPIVPKESSAPPPPDDRPYDTKLLRLTEILGAVHYLRELCGAQEGQLWRNQMKDILKNEGSTAVRRAKLVNSFNDGYRGYRRTYRSCTSSATLAINRFSAEGAQIAVSLAKPSVYANRNIPAQSVTPDAAAGQAAPGPTTPASGEAAPPQGATAPAQSEANANAGAPATQAAPTQGEAGQSATTPAATGETPPKPVEAGETAAQPDAVDQGEPRRERRKRKAQRVKPQAQTQAPAMPTGSGPQINR